MRIIHTSDLHYRPRIKETLSEFFREIALEKPDVLTIAGDHTGDYPDSVRAIFELAREHYDGPIVSCLGNHDYWAHVKVKDQAHMINEFEIKIRQAGSAAEDHNVHLLEEHGVWSSPDHYGICILGHGGWYFRGHTKSNDYDYMPIFYDNQRINEYMNKRAEDAVRLQVSTLTDDDWSRVAMTHFPVVDIGIEEYRDVAGGTLGQLLREAGCKKFLSGHVHNVRHNGPVRYQAGGDHGCPKYVRVEVI